MAIVQCGIVMDKSYLMLGLEIPSPRVEDSSEKLHSDFRTGNKKGRVSRSDGILPPRYTVYRSLLGYPDVKAMT